MYKSGDIVAVPFSFTEGDTEKRRPALVVSSGRLSEPHGLYWLIMITSAANRAWEDDIQIADHAKAGLSAPSIVRTSKIATWQEDRIIRKIGRLSKSELEDVRKAMSGFLG